MLASVNESLSIISYLQGLFGACRPLDFRTKWARQEIDIPWKRKIRQKEEEEEKKKKTCRKEKENKEFRHGNHRWDIYISDNILTWLDRADISHIIPLLPVMHPFRMELKWSDFKIDSNFPLLRCEHCDVQIVEDCRENISPKRPGYQSRNWARSFLQLFICRINFWCFHLVYLRSYISSSNFNFKSRSVHLSFFLNCFVSAIQIFHFRFLCTFLTAGQLLCYCCYQNIAKINRIKKVSTAAFKHYKTFAWKSTAIRRFEL